MKRTKRYLIVICSLVLVVAGTGGIWVSISGWPPIIIRTRHYEETIDAFKRATVRDRIKSSTNNAGWDFLVESEGSNTIAQVRAGTVGVVKIKYQDEDADRILYEYVDYCSPAEIRTSGKTLYVHWVETLIGTSHWILAYDISNRRELTKCRVDPADLKDSVSALRKGPMNVSVCPFTCS